MSSARSASFLVILIALLGGAVLAGCASSNGAGAPDAEVDATQVQLDAAVPDALVPDASPDAEPCIPDPDGETCNGSDDDCDGTADEGYPGVGDVCSVGVGGCQVTGTTVCTVDGTGTECGAVATLPGAELCDNDIDDNCNGMTDEGFDNLGDVCSAGAGACIASGIYVCSGTGLTTQCNATPGDGGPETCNGVDDNCNGQIDEGFQVSQACDGLADGDLCLEGVWACDGVGGRTCSDPGDEDFDVCNGVNDDCDPTTGDGSQDGDVGDSCDGGDGDLCFEGTRTCQSGGLVCNDFTGDARDVCDGGDNDCDPSSADGTEDPLFNVACDSTTDTDLCTTGVNQCNGGLLQCSDDAASTVDLCGGGDEDCDGNSADGSEHPGVGASCDGTDSDLCFTGNQVCSGTTLACNDDVAATVDLCGGGDEDCDGSSPDGSEHPGVGASCDGTDSDLCFTGNQACSGTTLACNDDAAATVDLCGGGNEDCDDSSADGTEHPGWNAVCDSSDSDLCFTGNQLCNGTGLACSDDLDSTLDLCGGGNEDCDDTSVDGSEHPGLGASCDGTDSDLCFTGNQVCNGAGLACNDDAAATIDLCGGGNEDCDLDSADGSEDPNNGSSCDGGDGDACYEGSNSCVNGGWSCSDGTGTTVELCNGDAVDENCNGLLDEGYVRDDNSGCWTTDLTSVRGDEGADFLSRTAYHEEWYLLYISEANNGSVYLSATVSLDSPLGADFDLYTYCFNCGGSVAGSSTTGSSAAAHTDTVNLRANDDFGFEDGHYVLVEVRHFSSNRCANYTLRVTGNTSVSSQTCDP